MASPPDFRFDALREMRGVTLRDIAQQTRIRIEHLQAIEAGEFDMLPPGIYTRSYIRQYACAIGVNADELMRLLPEHRETEPPPDRVWTGVRARVRQILALAGAILLARRPLIR